MYMFQSVIEDLRRLLPSYRIAKEKKDLRAMLSQKRRIMTKEDAARGSQEVVTQLLDNPQFRQAQDIMIYYPIGGEVDLLSLITACPDKNFYLPVSHRSSIEVRKYIGEDNLKRGKFGIPEPQTPAYKGKIDLICVPGVAFDSNNRRLGRGGGYYDRFLSSYRKTTKIGVCYHFQLVNRIPHNRHDKQMNLVISANSI